MVPAERQRRGRLRLERGGELVERDKARKAYEAALKKDPIDRFRTYLEGRELWTSADEEKADADATQLVQEQADLAEAKGFAGPEDLFDHVFAELTPQLREQREAVLGGR
mgnify:CR=1 FL=1